MPKGHSTRRVVALKSAYAEKSLRQKLKQVGVKRQHIKSVYKRRGTK